MEESAAAIVTGPAAAAPLKLSAVHQQSSSGGDSGASPGSGSFLMSEGKSPSPPPPQSNDARSPPLHGFGGMGTGGGGGSPLLHGKPLPPTCFPLSLLYGQPSSYLFVGSAPLVPLPPPPPPPPAPGSPHDLHARGLLFPPLHGSFAPPFDPLSKFNDEAKPLPLCLLQERMAASCLELAVGRSAFNRRAAALEAALQNASRGSPYEQASKWRCDDPALLKLQSQPAFPESPKCSEASPCSDGPLSSVVSPKWSAGQSASCPVCGATLAHAAQMADHLQMEMDKLADFYSCRRWMIQESSSGDEDCPVSATAERRPPFGPDKRSPLSRWETYLKVRGNRQQRLNAFCGRKQMQQQQQRRSLESLNLPLDLKATRHQEPRVDDAPLKMEVGAEAQGPGDGDGQQRQHPCGSPFSPVSPGAGAEDGGGAGGDPAAANSPSLEKSGAAGSCWPDEDGRPSLRCGVCREPYCKPVVSVCCWHVHCERCWLQSLGSKRLCPQCETITCPADLRKIHL